MQKARRETGDRRFFDARIWVVDVRLRVVRLAQRTSLSPACVSGAARPQAVVRTRTASFLFDQTLCVVVRARAERAIFHKLASSFTPRAYRLRLMLLRRNLHARGNARARAHKIASC